MKLVKVKKDLTNKVFGKLTVIQQAEDYVKPNGRREPQWLCKCSCGQNKEIVVLDYSLKSGNTKSCGCLRQEQAVENGKTSWKGNQVELNLKDDHGLYGIGRCSNTGSKFYFDMDDYDKICQYTWSEHIMQSWYHALETNIDGVVTRMSWIIIGKYYDHEDRNPLNNRKYNLRKATFAENAQNISKRKDNTSGVTGVFYRKNECVWTSYININKKRKYLGIFMSKNDAIKARLLAEAKYYGEFAPQRHLFEQYKIDIKGGDEE